MTARCHRGPLAGLLAGALLGSLGGCGTNLLVLRQDVEFLAADGSSSAARVEYRIDDGIVVDLVENPVAGACVGLLLEPVDWVASTWIAASAMFDDRQHVAWGPLGWLASLSPFATLVPRLEFPPALRADATAVQLGQLRSADAAARTAAAREVLGDRRIEHVECR